MCRARALRADRRPVGDIADYYRVDLVEGQVIELVIPSAQPGFDDADLFLLDPSLAVVDASVGEGQVEQVTVPANGTYFIDVEVFSGACLYRLSVGQTTAISGVAGLRLSDEFIPGEAIVTLKSAGKAAAQSTDGDAILAERYGTSHKGGDSGRAMLLELPTARASVAATAAIRGWRVASAEQQRKLDTLLHIKQLRADPDVRSADLNRVMRTSRIPNDIPGYAIQRWHYEQIQLPGAWDMTTGTPIRVAVVDTGVASHPELASKLIDGRDLISDPTNADGDGIDANPTDPGCPISGGSIFHGTHVAGTIGARSDDGTGVAGVSWGARIMPVRALDGCAGTGSSFDIMQGVRYAAGLSNDSGTLPSQRAAVINLSFGADAVCDATTVALYEEVRAQGVVVVAAAGNDAASAAQTPASCPNVISVSSVGPQRTRAPYSNFGTLVDVAAPGGDMSRDVNGDGLPDGVYSTHASGGGATTFPTFEHLQGTSMAAPHVAGVIALMLSVDSRDDAGADRRAARAGRAHGRHRSARSRRARSRAHQRAQGRRGRRPVAAALAADAERDPLLTRLRQHRNDGGGLCRECGRRHARHLRGGTVRALAFGVSDIRRRKRTGPVQFERQSRRPYGRKLFRLRRVLIKRRHCARQRPHGGRRRSAVSRALAAVHPADRCGHRRARAQVEVQADGTTVSYQFDGVASGEYIVLSGTDLDNDGSICDPAEACGAYPVENAPETIVVDDGVVDGLDFLVTYRTGVPTTASSRAVSKRP